MALLGAALVVVAYWFLEIRPRMQHLGGGPGSEVSRSRTVRLSHNEGLDFDYQGALRVEPAAAASNGRELLIASRKAPGGFLRLTPAGETKFDAQRISVIESTYQQEVSFHAVAWNGLHYVGYTDHSWFQPSDDQVFVMLEPATLAIQELRPAPPLLGCLAWDGTGYWAGTRRNTRDAPEEAWLYRLDPLLAVVGRFKPPGVGCQGMTWDGRRLWWADTFSDSLMVLDVAGLEPEVVREYPLRVDHPSGLVWDGASLWLGEFDEGSIRRLNPRLREAWSNAPIPWEGDDPFASLGAGLEMMLEPLASEEAGEILQRLSEGEGEITPEEASRLGVQLQDLFEQGAAGLFSTGEAGGSGEAGPGGLEGVWEGSLAGTEGQWTAIVTGEIFFIQGPDDDAWMKGDLRLDVEQGLPVLDIKINECDCPYRKKKVRALYRVDGGSLIVAAGDPGEVRPGSLEPAERTRMLKLSRPGGP
jgi:hypothetical protein